MNDGTLLIEKRELLSSKLRFLIMIGTSIIITFILVVVGLYMYNSSGAAQLDLSRPGYQGFSSKSITGDNNLQRFPNTGTITQDTLNEFQKLFDQQATNIKTADAFGGDPLSPESLGVSSASITIDTAK